MNDVSGASFSIARPLVNNNGVNPQRESDNQETSERLRATNAPQPDQQLNSNSTDVASTQSISSQLEKSVKPSENNTQEGDRSQNSIELSVGEKTTTVTREQVVDAVDSQLQRNAIDRAQQNSNVGPAENDRPVAAAVVANSDSSEEARETAFDLAATKNKTETTQFAFDQIEQANESASGSDESSENSNLTNFNQTFAEIGKDASQQQVRNEFISSREPEQGLGLNVDTRT